MIENLRQGYWVSATPFGYTNLNKREKAKNHKYVINQEGELLKLAFKWKAEGKMNNLEIVEKLHKLGCSVNYKSFVRVITNPFYCGHITHSLIPDEIFKGKHPALISEQLFLQANNKVSLNPHKGISKKAKINAITLKSFVKDELSLSPFTGYLKKGIYYYKTRMKGSAVNVRADNLNHLFVEELKKIELKSDYVAQFQEYLSEILTKKLNEQFETDILLKKQISELKKKLSCLNCVMLKVKLTVKCSRSINNVISYRLMKKPMNCSKVLLTVRTSIKLLKKLYRLPETQASCGLQATMMINKNYNT